MPMGVHRGRRKGRKKLKTQNKAKTKGFVSGYPTDPIVCFFFSQTDDLMTTLCALQCCHMNLGEKYITKDEQKSVKC